MYDVQLTTSYFPAQTDQIIRDITIGDALAEAVRDHSDRPALTEIGIDGATGRRWTYSEMAADAERLAFALASRFKKGERVVVWAPNIPEMSRAWVSISCPVRLYTPQEYCRSVACARQQFVQRKS